MEKVGGRLEEGGEGSIYTLANSSLWRTEPSGTTELEQTGSYHVPTTT